MFFSEKLASWSTFFQITLQESAFGNPTSVKNGVEIPLNRSLRRFPVEVTTLRKWLQNPKIALGAKILKQ